MSRLEKYSSYKESGVEWLGEIPEGWEVRRLGNMGMFSASGIDKYLNKNESPVKIINFTDIFSNKSHILNSNINYMQVTTPEENRKKHLVKKGDLIFLPSSETYEDLGLSALVDEELDNTSFSYHVIRLQFKKDIYHSFRKYLTNNYFVLNQFASFGKGTTRKIIGRNVFKNIRVLIPTPAEQTKIASFLDTKTEQLDKAIKQKEQLIELLKERRQILINDAVTKGIDKTVAMKDTDFKWLGKIPEHWELKALKYIIKERIERSDKGDETLFMMSQIHGLVVRSDYHDKAVVAQSSIGNKKVYKNDLVFNKLKAHLGVFSKSNIDEVGIVSPDYAVYYSIDNIADLKYLEYLFKNPIYISHFISKATGVVEGLIRLYTDDLFSLKVPVPPKIEQEKILAHIQENNQKIDKAIDLQQQLITKLKEYKTTLINSVVTGKVRVAF